MPRKTESAERSSGVDEIWLAEVGDHGWSQVCSTFAEASHVVADRRKELEIRGRCVPEDYNHWCIWRNGEYYIGNWKNIDKN